MSVERGLVKEQVDSIIQLVKQNGWQEAFEPNQYLVAKYVKENDNIKIYRTKAGDYTLVCNTIEIKKQILEGKFISDTIYKYEVEIDDAGVGCPAGGIAIGYRPSVTRVKLKSGVEKEYPSYIYDIIDVKFFQSPLYDQKTYLQEVTTKILQHFQQWEVNENWLIRICTGYIFSHARSMLSTAGYNITTAKITGFLQDNLERDFRKYLETTCHIPFYLIKEIPATKVGFQVFFTNLIRYIKAHPLLLPYCKTGWPYFQKNFAMYLHNRGKNNEQ